VDEHLQHSRSASSRIRASTQLIGHMRSAMRHSIFDLEGLLILALTFWKEIFAFSLDYFLGSLLLLRS